MNTQIVQTKTVELGVEPPLGSNGWTPYQYAAFRALTGAYFALRFLILLFVVGKLAQISDLGAGTIFLPNPLLRTENPVILAIFFIIGVGCSGCYAAGFLDKAYAAVLLYLCWCVRDRWGAVPHGAFGVDALVLLLHLLIPKPAGVAGSVVPNERWVLPRVVHHLGWILLSLNYFTLGSVVTIDLVSKEGPSGAADYLIPSSILWLMALYNIVFVAVVWLPRLRQPMWWLMLFVYPVEMFVMRSSWEIAPMLLLHLFCFDPGWIRPTIPKKVKDGEPPAGENTIYYDGSCGLCHNFVLFVISEEGTPPLYNFAPLQGEKSVGLAEKVQLDPLPDSVVVVTNGGAKIKSDGVAAVLWNLGGIWRPLAGLIVLLPKGVRDAAYDYIARHRKQLVRAPEKICPMVPQSLQGRFLP